MEVTIKQYSQATVKVDLEVDEGCTVTVRSALDQAGRQYEGWSVLKNGTKVELDATVSDGDTLGLFPKAEGGSRA